MADKKPPEKQKKRSTKETTCTVVLLDGENFTVPFDKNGLGQTLFDKVADHLDLLEREFFSLTFVEIEGTGKEKKPYKYWLDHEKKISKQKKTDGAWVFEFAVKFYPPETSMLHDSFSRQLLTLQVRRDIVSGRLLCTLPTQALLGSYCVQADFDDFNPSEHGPRGDGEDADIEYIRSVPFAPSQTPELLRKIVELHKLHKGQTPEEAENTFLDNAKKLAFYGVDLHEAEVDRIYMHGLSVEPEKNKKGIEVMLGVSSTGLTLYKDNLRLNRFVWPKINKISYKRGVFYIKVKRGGEENAKPTEDVKYEFRFKRYRLAKRFWKTCVEHHAFFRLREPEDPNQNTKFPRLGSKFRYSGRTLYQSQRPASDKPLFDRTNPKRHTSVDSRSRSTDDLGMRPSYREEYKNKHGYYPEDASTLERKHPDDRDLDRSFPDERDRQDKKGYVKTPISDLGLAPGTGPYDDEEGTMKKRPEEYSTDTADRRDKTPTDQEATMTNDPRYGGNEMAVTAGTVEGQSPPKKLTKEEEKERKKREKEEEKKRKEEKKRLEKEEKEKKKKKGKDKDHEKIALDELNRSAEDRRDRLGSKDATESAEPGHRPDSSVLESAEIMLAANVPRDESAPDWKDRQKEGEKGSELDRERYPGSEGRYPGDMSLEGEMPPPGRDGRYSQSDDRSPRSKDGERSPDSSFPGDAEHDPSRYVEGFGVYPGDQNRERERLGSDEGDDKENKDKDKKGKDKDKKKGGGLFGKLRKSGRGDKDKKEGKDKDGKDKDGKDKDGKHKDGKDKDTKSKEGRLDPEDAHILSDVPYEGVDLDSQGDPYGPGRGRGPDAADRDRQNKGTFGPGVGAGPGGYGGVGVGAGRGFGGPLTAELGDETFIDRKMEFLSSDPPEKLRVETNKIRTGIDLSDSTMPFFNPAATSTTGRPGKVPPPVPPKGKGGYGTEDRNRIKSDLYKTEKDGVVETRVERKVVIQGDSDGFDHDAALAEAILSVTQLDPDISVERIECMRQMEEVGGDQRNTAV